MDEESDGVCFSFSLWREGGREGERERDLRELQRKGDGESRAMEIEEEQVWVPVSVSVSVLGVSFSGTPLSDSQLAKVVAYQHPHLPPREPF